MLSFVVLMAAVPAVHIQTDNSRTFLLGGSARIGYSQPRKAYLNAFCSNADFHFALILPNARWNSEFDYDNFDGADAPAMSVALSHISWTGSSFGSELSATATGSYEFPMFGPIDYQIPLREPQPTAFRFDSAAPMETWRQFLFAIDAGAGSFTWTQTAFDDLNRRLVATFAFDAAASSRLVEAAMSCSQPAT